MSSEQNVPKMSAADLLAADMVALRGEMRKPLAAIHLLHKLIANGTGEKSMEKIVDRLNRVCLWAITGDDDYLTSASDRAALLGPAPASDGPSAGGPKPS